MLEVDQGAFSIEPFLYVDGALVTWSDVADRRRRSRTATCRSRRSPGGTTASRSRVTAFAAGDRRRVDALRSATGSRTDGDRAPQPVRLFLALRPFQVLPPWQSLNMVGRRGADPRRSRFDGARRVGEPRPARSCSLDAARPLRRRDLRGGLGRPTSCWRARCRRGRRRDAIRSASPRARSRYDLDLEPGATREVALAVPFHEPRRRRCRRRRRRRRRVATPATTRRARDVAARRSTASRSTLPPPRPSAIAATLQDRRSPTS